MSDVKTQQVIGIVQAYFSLSAQNFVQFQIHIKFKQFIMTKGDGLWYKAFHLENLVKNYVDWCISSKMQCVIKWEIIDSA